MSTEDGQGRMGKMSPIPNADADWAVASRKMAKVRVMLLELSYHDAGLIPPPPDMMEAMAMRDELLIVLGALLSDSETARVLDVEDRLNSLTAGRYAHTMDHIEKVMAAELLRKLTGNDKAPDVFRDIADLDLDGLIDQLLEDDSE